MYRSEEKLTLMTGVGGGVGIVTNCLTKSIKWLNVSLNNSLKSPNHWSTVLWRISIWIDYNRWLEGQHSIVQVIQGVSGLC